MHADVHLFLKSVTFSIVHFDLCVHLNVESIEKGLPSSRF